MPESNGNITPDHLQPSSKGEIIVRVYEAISEGPADQVPEQDLVKTNDTDPSPNSFGVSDRDPKPAKQKVVYKLKNINTQPIATFVFKYQSGRPTPIITPTRNNSLYSIPMYTPESAKVDTTPRTPEPSGRKRSRESEANDQTPSKQPKLAKSALSSAHVTPRSKKTYQAPTVESEGEEESEKKPEPVPIRAPQFKKQQTPHRTSSLQKPGKKYQAYVEDEDDSSVTLQASSPSPPRPEPAPPTKDSAATSKETSTSKAAPKKPQLTPKKAPSTPANTPSKLQGRKLKPRNNPKEDVTDSESND